MEQTITLQEKLKISGSFDVIVAGGGVAGVAAALSARRRGATVLLLEKANILGGLATTGLVNLFVAMCNGRGRQIIFGMAEEFLREAIKYGYDDLNKNFVNGVNPVVEDKKRYKTKFDPYIFAPQLTKMLLDAGVHLYLDCMATTPVMDGTTCKGITVESTSGRAYFACKELIDTTGSGEIMRRMGVPTVNGKNYYTYFPAKIDFEDCKEALEKKSLKKLIKDIPVGSVNLYGENQPENVPQWSGTTVEEVTDYLTHMQLRTLDILKEQDKNSRIIARMPMMPQFRTICHIDGDYTFTVEDEYRHMADSVCAINDFDFRDKLYEVPYRCLYKSGWPNLLTAGRCASAKGYGWDVLRVIPPAILTGQAAGEAAALAIEQNRPVSDIDINQLQLRLEKDGHVMIHFPDELIPEDRTICEAGKSEER